MIYFLLDAIKTVPWKDCVGGAVNGFPERPIDPYASPGLIGVGM